MKVSKKKKKRDCYADGEYDVTTNQLKVFAGAKLSAKKDEKFRLAKEANNRENPEIVKNLILKKDMIFKSPSVAAQFIACSSLNGLKVWKTEDGKPLGISIKEG